MWTRAMLKTNARAALTKNYINVVIASLIFAFISELSVLLPPAIEVLLPLLQVICPRNSLPF